MLPLSDQVAEGQHLGPSEVLALLAGPVGDTFEEVCREIARVARLGGQLGVGRANAGNRAALPSIRSISQ